MDISGNFVTHGGSHNIKSGSQSGNSSVNGSSSNHSSLSSYLSSLANELDVEVEEQLARASFSYHRVRLAYQRAVDNKKANASFPMKSAAIYTAVVGIVMMIVGLAFYYNIFNQRINMLQRGVMLGNLRYGADSTIFLTLYYWMISNNILETDGQDHLMDLEAECSINTEGMTYTIEMTRQWYDESGRMIVLAANNLGNFIDQTISEAAAGTDVFTIYEQVTKAMTPFTPCSPNGVKLELTKSFTSLKNALTYLTIKTNELTRVGQDPLTWAQSKALCEIFANMISVQNAFNALAVSLSSQEVVTADGISGFNTIFVLCFTLSFFVTSVGPLLFFLSRFFHELQAFLDLMRGIEDHYRKAASQPLGKLELNENDSYATSSNKHSNLSCGWYSVLVIIPALCGCALFIGIIILSNAQNSVYKNYSTWIVWDCGRSYLSLEAVIYSYFLMATADPIVGPTIQFTDSTRLLKVLNDAIDQIDEYNTFFLRGGNGIEGVLSRNADIDYLNVQDTCKGQTNPTPGDNSLHSTYKCLSIDSLISTFSILLKAFAESYDTENFLKDSSLVHIFHLMNDHLTVAISKSFNLLVEAGQSRNSLFQQDLLALSLCGIVVMLICFLMLWILIGRLDQTYDGALQVLRKLPPVAVVSSIPLLDVLMNRKEEKKNDKQTTAMSVISNSGDAILCLNRNETIEIVNQSVNTILGFTKEQLLGQPISAVVPASAADSFYKHMIMMRAGQCALFHECSIAAVTDNDISVPVHTTLIGICKENSSEASSFVVVLRDETKLKKQQEEAEQAKTQSEKLLFQILPRDIVTRLNSGENDISFSVPHATIIFIDIVKFSDYSAALSPPQIMVNLSQVFARFDSACARYQLITKIKLIGDVYMAAAGLFSHDDDSLKHAVEVVQFGLDALSALEEANTLLDSNLQVRIGVNTGGPIIAGVLGTDKPVFDIIGDPINVAARLQSTGIPGSVQISQSTFDLISNLNFNIEPRGEIELKGKGKKMAYMVNPTQAASFFMASSSDQNNKNSGNSMI